MVVRRSASRIERSLKAPDPKGVCECEHAPRRDGKISVEIEYWVTSRNQSSDAVSGHNVSPRPSPDARTDFVFRSPIQPTATPLAVFVELLNIRTRKFEYTNPEIRILCTYILTKEREFFTVFLCGFVDSSTLLLQTRPRRQSSVVPVPTSRPMPDDADSNESRSDLLSTKCRL